jgi:hypothetical protein
LIANQDFHIFLEMCFHGFMHHDTESYRPAKQSLCAKHANRLLTFLLVVTLFTFALGALLFAQPVDFIMDFAYSHVGRLNTYNGNSNHIALLFFILSLLVSAGICFRIDRLIPREFNHHLFFIAGIGYLLMIPPCDVWYVIHSAGAVLVIGSFWLFLMYSLIHMQSFLGWRKFILYQVLLQGTILPYAFLYIMDSSAKQALQKIAIIGIILSLKITTREIARQLDIRLDHARG